VPKPRGEGKALRLSNFLTQELSEPVAGTTLDNVGSFRTEFQIRVLASQNAGEGMKGFCAGVAAIRATHGLSDKLRPGFTLRSPTFFTNPVREYLRRSG
jgi:hypothetical protein